MKKKVQIEIFDSTLREGAQTPHVNFSFEDKKLVLKKLFELGVDFAEVGYPSASKTEMEEIIKLTQETNRPQISVLGRLLKEDIKKSLQSGAEIIDIDLGISPYQLEYLKIGLNEALKKAFEVIKYAAETRKRIKFAALDFNRTSVKELNKLYKVVSKAGAEWFTLCDTVGAASPDQVKYYLSKLTDGCKIAVHFHNDFDQAAANTIAAALSGATQLELTINGLGDRAGIAAMAPVVVYLKEIAGLKINIDLKKLKKLANLVSKISKIPLSPLEPIVGKYCFKHSPGIHVAGVINNNKTFEPLKPEIVGQKRTIVLGRYTGKKAVKKYLEQENISFRKMNLEKLTSQIKEESIKRKRSLTKKELLRLINQSVK